MEILKALLGRMAVRAILTIVSVGVMLGWWSVKGAWHDHKVARLRARYETVGDGFAKAVLARDDRAAYELASASLKGRMDFDAFKQALSDARTEYGRPLKYETSIDTPDEDAKGASATLDVVYALEVDPQGDIVRCYTMSAMLVDEGGEGRVDSFDFDWCD